MWKELSPDEDRKLVARCLEGDPLAFEELVRKYQQAVINLAYHYIGYKNEVEDIAQKVFVKVYFSLPKFDIQRPFFPWLIAIRYSQDLNGTPRQRYLGSARSTVRKTSATRSSVTWGSPVRR